METLYYISRTGNNLYLEGIKTLEEAFQKVEKFKSVGSMYVGQSISIYSYTENDSQRGNEDNLIYSTYLKYDYSGGEKEPSYKWITLDQCENFLYKLVPVFSNDNPYLFQVLKLPVLPDLKNKRTTVLAEGVHSILFVDNHHIDSEIIFSEYNASGYIFSSLSDLESILQKVLLVRKEHFLTLIQELKQYAEDLILDSRTFLKKRTRFSHNYFGEAAGAFSFSLLFNMFNFYTELFVMLESIGESDTFVYNIPFEGDITIGTEAISEFKSDGYSISIVKRYFNEYLVFINRERYSTEESFLALFNEIKASLRDLLLKDIYSLESFVENIDIFSPLTFIEFLEE